MKQLLISILCSPLCVFAQTPPPAPASAQDVIDGTATYKFVSPYALSQSSLAGGGAAVSNRVIAAVPANFYTNSTPHYLIGYARLGISGVGTMQCSVTNSANTRFFDYTEDALSVSATSNTIAFTVPPYGWYKFAGQTTVLTEGNQALFYYATNGSVSFAATAGTVTDGVTQAGLAAGSYAISFSLSNVTSYAQRVGLDFANSNKVWQWANHRRLYSNAYTNLVDCCFLRSNLNASSVSTIQTFSRTNTVSLTDSSSMVYDSNGLYLPGSATQRAYWLSVPDCQTNTLIYQARTWNKAGVSHNGNDFFHYWNGTYGSSPYSAQMLALNNGNVYFQTYSSVGSFGSSGVVFDISASGIQPDGWLRTYVYSQDGSGQYISVDGLWAASGNTTNRLGATATGFTAGFTNIQIGFQNGTYNVPCLSQVWMLFDKVLTGAEEIEERAALRFLDDSSENHVIIGDSRAAHAYNGTNSWSGELENYAKYKGRWYDIAKAGEYTTNINFNGVYLTNAAKWRPRGGATKTTAWMLTGVNDSGASVAAATTWGAYSNIAFKLREAGMEVKAVIPCLGNAYSTLETQLAWYIRTNSFMFNEVIEMGKIVSDYDFSQGGTYYSPDTLHFSTNTAKLLSHWIGTGYKRTWPRRVSIPSQVPTVTTGTYFLTNTYGWRHRAIIYGGTVTGVSLGTNTVSIGTVVPTIEIDPWCWIAVTNSVVPSIFFQTVD